MSASLFPRTCPSLCMGILPVSPMWPEELDLCFQVKNPAECKLTPEILARQPLEVLRLEINVEIKGDTDIPVICLLNLKLLHLRSLVFTEDDFVTRLVSNFPVLEDLFITRWWLKADRLIISSNSLRRFVFDIHKYSNEEESSDLVPIDTPNLKLPLPFDTVETSFRKQLSLARALSNVKHLSLLRWSIKGFYYAAKVKDQLPMFRNLRTLKLGALCYSLCSARWDIVLLLIFHRSPLLEELVFEEGFFFLGNDTCDYHDPDDSHAAPYEAAWEAASWGITQTIPSCGETHLKRIRIYNCCGRDRELNMIRFLLGNAPILKEFVISMSKRPYGIRYYAPKFDQFKNTLEEIPRASNSCSIIYYDDEPAWLC
ncbi:hypothetical protein RND81_13G041900 [Saponaria officinalis]|uniref:FBD domain-containing protein n=1 Tax=Saponaria officinalis TaxID=3572 RepID=A0AAW1GVX6_SAPOF